MKKLIAGFFLIFVSLAAAAGAWTYWDVLTKSATLLIGVVIGACIAASLLLLLWRPAHPATRYQANLPSPWDRRSWR
jgi:hypothetical protein